MRILSWAIQTRDRGLSSAELNSDLTVVLARDEGAKSAFLRFVEQALPGTGNGTHAAPASSLTGHLVLGTANGNYKVEPSHLTATAKARMPPLPKPGPHHLCIRATDAGELAGLDARAIAERLLGPATAEGSGALAMLRLREEESLGAADRPGSIVALVERFRAIEKRIDAARDRDAIAGGEIESLLGDGAAVAQFATRRDLIAERERLAAILGLWPHWRSLEGAAAELRSMPPLDAAIAAVDARFDDLVERRGVAENAQRLLLRRLEHMKQDLAGIRTKSSLTLVGEAAKRMADEVPAYRDRLLDLAATRARLAELDRAIAAAPGALGAGWDLAAHAQFASDPANAATLAVWRERFRAAEKSRTGTERHVADLRERMDALCDEVRQQLASEPWAERDDLDASWRALWRLRADLEEIWLVRSRGESRARALQDLEPALQSAESASLWIPPARLGDLVSFLVIAAAGGAVARAVGRDFRDAALLGVAALVLLAGRLAMHGWTNWSRLQQRKARADAQKLRAEVAALRSGRDSDWKRAEELTNAIASDAARLGFSGTPTQEAVEQCEHDLAERLRAEGPRTALGALLQRLLAAQEEEQASAAAVSADDEAREALHDDWDTWRAGAGLPAGVDPDGAAAGLERLAGLAASIAERDGTRAAMTASEPRIAAWEAEARTLLGRVGVEVPHDLCGRALATELGVLRRRVERNDERDRRRAALEAQIAETEQQLAAGEIDLSDTLRSWTEIIAQSGAAGDEDLRDRIAAFRLRRAAQGRVEELERSIAARLGALGDAARARAELAGGAVERWGEEIKHIDARLGELERLLGANEERWRAAEPELARARGMVELPDLLLEREETLAELDAAARRWRLLAIARGLIEESLAEIEGARRREILDSASRVLAALSAGAYTAIVADAKSGGLALVRADGSRLVADADLDASTIERLYLSVRLGHAAHLASRGAAVPLILDDVLAPFAPADAHAVAREIAAAARGNQVLYLTTNAESRNALCSAAGTVPVLEI